MGRLDELRKMAESEADLLSLLEEIDAADAPLDAYDPDSLASLGSLSSSDAWTAHIGEEKSEAAQAQAPSHVERCRLNRKRKKRELEELRQAEATLQRKLHQLQNHQQELSGGKESSWRAVSRAVMLDYHRAMKENKQLREMWEQHIHAGRLLQRALQALPDMKPIQSSLESGATQESVVSSKRSCGDGVSGFPIRSVPREQFQHLFRNIHLTYHKNKRGRDLAWLKIGSRKISMEILTEGDVAGMSVQVMECQRLALTLDQVSDATWRRLCSPCVGDCSADNKSCSQTNLTLHGDELFGECGTDCSPLPSTEENPPGLLAIRRYVEPRRLTFVWECDGCYQCDSTKKPIGRVVERGRCTIEASGDEDTTTIFRIHVQYIPKTADRVSTASLSLSSEVALSLYQGTLSRTFGAMKNHVFHRQDGSKSEAKPTCCG